MGPSPLLEHHRCQDMSGIGPLGTSGFDPAARFPGRQKRVKQALGRLMGEQPLPKIMSQGKVEPRVVQIEAQGILPIHTMPDSIGGLTIREPFDILHHHDQRQAPGGYCHRVVFQTWR